MDVEMTPIDEVIPYEGNPRLNDKAVKAVARSLEEFGWRQPVVVDRDCVVICGHTRLKAARLLGLSEVPVHVAHDLTPAQVKAYRLADNATGERAEWNMDLLPLELGALQGAGFDLSVIGFPADAVAQMLEVEPGTGATDPNSVPSAPADAVTETGDVWVLGEHRLMCGDSGVGEDVDALLMGAPVHLVNTDPPYNVKVEPASAGSDNAGRKQSWRSTEEQRGVKARRTLKPTATRDADPESVTGRALLSDFVSDAAFDAMLSAWFGTIERVLVPGRAFYVWGGYANLFNYPEALRPLELHFAQAIIWVKEHPVLGRKDFMGNHEWCFYGWREGAAHVFLGPNNIPDVWRLERLTRAGVEPGAMLGDLGVRVEAADGDRLDLVPPAADKNRHTVTLGGGEGVTLYGSGAPSDVWLVRKLSHNRMIHLTEKPVELASRAMRYSSRAGENVLDLFGGSGSTLIAAEMMQRRAFLMEMDPLYCDVIVRRWEAFAGGKAVRQ